MNWLSFLLMMLLAQGGAAPRQQQQLAQNRSQERASIYGYVVKMGTGEPVGKATVTLSPFNSGRAQSFTATTTSGGQFAFQNLEPGQYRLAAARNGFIRMEFGARSPNRPGLPIQLNAGQRVTDALLQIMPAGTISGRVFDRDGEPLANVNVEALRYSYQQGQRVMNEVQSARTNDLGEYRLFWLQPGQYFISATPPENRRVALLNALSIGGPGIAGAVGEIIAQRVEARGGRGEGRGGRGEPGPRGGGPGAGPNPPPVLPPQDEAPETYVPVYYPGTTDAQAAAPINLPPGIVFSGVDMTVAAVRTLKVAGQVINGVTGQPAQNAQIALIPLAAGNGRGGIRNPGNFRSRINNGGTFEIRGVPPGSYEVVAMFNERNNRMTARLPLEIGSSDVQNVSLILSPGFSLTGRLAIEGQAGTGNQDVSRIRVMLRPDSAGQVLGGASPNSAVKADGAFALEQVGRDDYRLTVTGMPRNAYVKTARYGSTDVMSEGLRLDRQPTGPLEILVSTSSGVADGIVQTDKQEPAINVMVVLVPEAARRTRLDLYRTISTDAAGRFHLEGIPPGDYRVFAWEDVETGAWTDPDFIRRFEDRGKPVRINEGSSSNIELRLIPPQM